MNREIRLAANLVAGANALLAPGSRDDGMDFLRRSQSFGDDADIRFAPHTHDSPFDAVARWVDRQVLRGMRKFALVQPLGQPTKKTLCPPVVAIGGSENLQVPNQSTPVTFWLAERLSPERRSTVQFTAHEGELSDAEASSLFGPCSLAEAADQLRSGVRQITACIAQEEHRQLHHYTTTFDRALKELNVAPDDSCGLPSSAYSVEAQQLMAASQSADVFYVAMGSFLDYWPEKTHAAEFYAAVAHLRRGVVAGVTAAVNSFEP